MCLRGQVNFVRSVEQKGISDTLIQGINHFSNQLRRIKLMKQLVCEMCGSTDLVKQDGMFVCQTCGTKYSVEEAKKMMIEGTVDVQGTVKVDNSTFVEKYLANARRAKQKEDWAEVEKYYNLVEQNDPSNIEAIFYSAYGKARLSLVELDIDKRTMICQAFINSISIIDDNYNLEKKEENQIIINQMSDDLFELYKAKISYPSLTSENKFKVRNDIGRTYKLRADMALAFVESLENIIKIDDQLLYWQLIYKQLRYVATQDLGITTGGPTVEDRKSCREKAFNIAKIIHDKDPSIELEDIPDVKDTKGCYVATAVYGSYDCPQVWTLRRYRDYTLAETWYGRLFIRTYYAISPTLVKWFGHTKWFKKMWRGKLDRMVKNLKEKGVLDTPYEDRQW